MHISTKSLLLIASVVIVSACSSATLILDQSDLDLKLNAHSSSTFKGYFYLGSDSEYHFFEGRWDFQQDEQFQVAKELLNIVNPDPLGGKGIEVTLMKSSGYIFGYSDRGVIYYKSEDIEGLIQSMNQIRSIESNWPSHFLDVDLNEEGGPINEYVKFSIYKVIEDASGNQIEFDSSFSLMDSYVGTICLPDSLYTLYVVLTDVHPDNLMAHVLFFDNSSNTFLSGQYDMSLFSLYDYDRANNKLNRSSLKETFASGVPEIEKGDFNGDGKRDYRFTRLYHNGTASEIVSQIVTIDGDFIQTYLTGRDSTVCEVLNAVFCQSPLDSVLNDREVVINSNELISSGRLLPFVACERKVVSSDSFVDGAANVVVGDFTTDWSNPEGVRVQLEILSEGIILNFYLRRTSKGYQVVNSAIMES